MGRPSTAEGRARSENSLGLGTLRYVVLVGFASPAAVDMGYLRMVGGAKHPPSNTPPANFSLGCEKFDFVEEFNGRGGEIRTPDPLLPKQMRYQAALRPDITQSYRIRR